MSLVTVKPKLMKAMYFDGDDYVAFVLPRQLEWTVEALARIDKVHSGVIVGLPWCYVWWSKDKGGLRCEFRNESDTAYRGIPQDGGNVYPYGQALGRFIHVVYTYDGSIIRGFINGEFYTQTNRIDEAGLDDPTGRIGTSTVAFPPGRYLNGFVALVRVYNLVLSEKEIRHNMSNLDNPVRDGLVLWFDARNVIGSTWYDLSPYRNHGTIYGAQQITLPNPPVPAGV